MTMLTRIEEEMVKLKRKQEIILSKIHRLEKKPYESIHESPADNYQDPIKKSVKNERARAEEESHR